MSPDARLIAAALIYAHRTVQVDDCAAIVGKLEAALTEPPTSPGSVPIGWVREKLLELQIISVDRYKRYSETTDAIRATLAQLAQFSEPV